MAYAVCSACGPYLSSKIARSQGDICASSYQSYSDPPAHEALIVRGAAMAARQAPQAPSPWHAWPGAVQAPPTPAPRTQRARHARRSCSCAAVAAVTRWFAIGAGTPGSRWGAPAGWCCRPDVFRGCRRGIALTTGRAGPCAAQSAAAPAGETVPGGGRRAGRRAGRATAAPHSSQDLRAPGSRRAAVRPAGVFAGTG